MVNIYKEKDVKNARALSELFRASILPTDYMVREEKVSPERVAAMIENPSVSIFVITDDGKLAGYCLTHRKKANEFKHRIFIQAIAISPEYRNRGLAQDLLQEVIKDAFKEKAEVVCLEVVSENKDAIRLYERAGMKECGRIPCGFKKNNRCIDTIMYCYAK